ncbi:MAG: hypothetical protein AAGA68_26420 [Pseudomonadota bacterium]
MNAIPLTRAAAMLACSATFALGTALAGNFEQDVFGPIVIPAQLERYEAIADSSEVNLLGVASGLRRSAGFDFPDGNPIGTSAGTVRFNRGLPLYYTVAAGPRTGLYGWDSNADNGFATADFRPGSGVRALRAWGYDAPMCAGVRGNGPRLWAHFTSIARLIEHYGPLGGLAGGSSGSITLFLTESAQANPLVTDCGNRVCSRVEAGAREAFWMKAIQGLTEAGLIGDIVLIVELIALIEEEGILALLQGDDPLAGVEALLDILSDPAVQSLINPEVIDLLLTSPDPVFHAIDLIDSLANAATFTVDDPTVFVRPGVINFDAFAEIVGRLGNFLAAYGEYDIETARSLVDACAVPGRFMDWPTVATLPAGDSTCGEAFSALFDDYLANLDDNAPSRLDDPIGRYVQMAVTTAVLQGDAVDSYTQARTQYLAAQPINWDVSFDDIRFGYWGRSSDIARAEARLASDFPDLKSQRFTSLGEAPWREILTLSPAEPGLARALELPDGRLSAGGWTDPVPTQVLQALGCEEVVLVNRRDGIGAFTTGVAELLGASEAELDALYDLADPTSSFSDALSRASGVWCTDWDAPDTFDIEGLSAEGYEAPFETDAPFFTQAPEPYEGISSDLNLVGCTPGVF